MTLEPVAQFPPLRPPIARPKWAAFLVARGYGMDDPDVMLVVGCSREYVRRLGLPWDHPKRRDPTADEIARIKAWTCGEISEGDWRPPTGGGERIAAPFLEAGA